jgi:hypothetical protein
LTSLPVNATFKLSCIKIEKGEGSLILVRGKKKMGYEVSLTAHLQTDEQEMNIRCVGICDDEEECLITVHSFNVSKEFVTRENKNIVKYLKQCIEILK